MREYKTRKGNKRAQLSLGFEPPGDRADRGRASAAPCGAGIPVERETEMEVSRTVEVGAVAIKLYHFEGAWWVRPFVFAKSIGIEPRTQRRIIERSGLRSAYLAAADHVGRQRPYLVIRLSDFVQWVLVFQPGRMSPEIQEGVRRLQQALKDHIDLALPSALGLDSAEVGDAQIVRRPPSVETLPKVVDGVLPWWRLWGRRSNG